ncbi:MAG: LysR family transcriptional regulator [Firmicutes bacterium]|nr:LysR family transcriptional regulator [Bacillota bacterium]
MHLESHEVFRAAVEYGSITKAAQALHLTQSTASRHLQALEDEYGGLLFSRSAAGITLTALGATLYPYTCTLLDCHAQAKEEMRRQSGMGVRISVGATLTIGEYVLPEILGAFRRRHPDAALRMRISNSHDIIEDLFRHRIDAALVEGVVTEHSDLSATPWMTDEVILVCANDHPFAERPHVTLADLIDQPLLAREHGSGTRQITEMALERAGILGDLTFDFELGSTQAIKSAIACGLGCAFLSRLTVRSELADRKLCEVPICDFHIHRTLHIVERLDKYPLRLMTELLHTIRQWSLS